MTTNLCPVMETAKKVLFIAAITIVTTLAYRKFLGGKFGLPVV